MQVDFGLNKLYYHDTVNSKNYQFFSSDDASVISDTTSTTASYAESYASTIYTLPQKTQTQLNTVTQSSYIKTSG